MMKEIVETMSRHEDLIAQLYHTYALKLPDMAEFWNSIYLQELRHRDWLHNLSELVSTGKLHFKEGRFKIQPLTLAVEYITGELSKAQQTKVTPKDALNKALQIEESMIEKKFFEVFETDSVDLKHVLQGLEKETGQHIGMIREKQASIG